MSAPIFASRQRVLVVPAPPSDRRDYVATCWLGVNRGKYEVAPVGGGPTRFVAAGEIQASEIEMTEGDGA